MGQLAELGVSGDVKTIWNKDNPDEVAVAQKAFDDLRAKKYTAFRVNDKGDPAEIMREFDPNAEKIIMSPMVKGG